MQCRSARDSDSGQRDRPSQQRPRDSRNRRGFSSPATLPCSCASPIGRIGNVRRCSPRAIAIRASSSASMPCADRCSTTSTRKVRAALRAQRHRRRSAAHRACEADLPISGLDRARSENRRRFARHQRSRRNERQSRNRCRCAARSPRAHRRRQPRRARAAGSNEHRRIAVNKPGRYQIGARVANEFVPLSDEYAIEVVPDEKPTIEIRKPGRDWRATSIEEVPVRIHAEDDFRLARRLAALLGERRRRGRPCRWAAAARPARASRSSTWRSWARRSGEGARRPRERTRAGRPDLVLRGRARSQRVRADRPLHGPGAAVRAAVPAGAGRQHRRRRHGRRAGRDLRAAEAKSCSRPGICSGATSAARGPSNSWKTARRCLSELQATLAQQARTLAHVLAPAHRWRKTSAFAPSSRVWSALRP